MKANPKDEWMKFKISLQSVLTGLKPDERMRLKKYGDRKYFFNELVLPKVAHDLTYILKPEFLRVDYTLMKLGECEFNVPMVCIESENNFDSCYEEILKLSSINAPLKILIAYGMPDDRLKDYTDNDIIDIYIFEDFLSITQLVGWYAVLVYDDTEPVPKFHVYVYNEKGERVTEECKHMQFG